MKIKKKILEKMDGNDALVLRLIRELNVSYPTIRRWINNNTVNGDLTKASALEIIREELDLTDDQILDRQKEAA